jgi:hypothetical protein
MNSRTGTSAVARCSLITANMATATAANVAFSDFSYLTRGGGACMDQHLGPSCGVFDPQAPLLGPKKSTHGPGGAQNDRKVEHKTQFRDFFFWPLVTQN